MLLLPYWHRFLPLFQRISDNLCRIPFADPLHSMLIHNSTLIPLVHSMFQWASVWVLCGAFMHSDCLVSLLIPHRPFSIQACWKEAFKGFPRNPAAKGSVYWFQFGALPSSSLFSQWYLLHISHITTGIQKRSSAPYLLFTCAPTDKVLGLSEGPIPSYTFISWGELCCNLISGLDLSPIWARTH